MFQSFLQTDAWAQFKQKFGWKARRSKGLLLLERSLPFGQKLTYLPELPFDEQTLESVGQLIKDLTQPGESTFTRFEFLTPWHPDRAAALLKLGLAKAFEDVQPEYRQWINLELSEPKLLEQMHPKGRYNIKVAQRHEVEVKFDSSAEMVKEFFDLYQATSVRTQFSGRSLPYFNELAQALSTSGLGEVAVAYHQGKPLSAAMIVYYEGLASYLYGGSSGERSVMAPYLMHWQIMRRAKKKGCLIYDLLAVAPPEATDKHPYAGITRFKQQFGGETIRLLGSWDLVQKPFWYTIYKQIETHRRKKVT